MNGLDGTNYKVQNFSNEGFINKAFTSTAIKKINITNVVNNIDSTTDYNNILERATNYVYKNTQDRIFLLSVNEVTNPAYGFDSYNKYLDDDDGTSYSNRLKKVVDYAIAESTFVNALRTSSDVDWKCAEWWLRSPCANYDDSPRCVSDEGCADSCDYTAADFGIVPALTLSF